VQTESDVLAVNEREAARRMGISPRTLWGLHRAGKIPAIRIGGRKGYAIADLAAFIATNKSTGEASK